MAGLPQITLIGNVTADPEHRTTANGKSVTNFTVAVAERTLDRDTNKWRDEAVSFYRVVAWNALADHVTDGVRKGTRVTVHGVLRVKEWEDKQGVKRPQVEVTAEDVGASLLFGGPKPAPAAAADPWHAPSGAAGDDKSEIPF